MKVNLFQTQDKDFKVLLQRFGKDVLVNNVKTRVIITNTSLSELDDKYVSAFTELKRGDHIQFEGKDYYVINQVKTRRYESYKAIIRCAEHYIRFNLSTYDAQAVKYLTYDIKEIASILQTTTDFGLDNGRQMLLAEGQLAIFIQDNPTTRAIYSTFTNSQTKHDIIIEDKQYKYIGFDFISKGLVRINVEITTTGTNSDNISWRQSSTHTDWDGFIDDSFYIVETPPVDVQEPEIPPVDEPPVDTTRRTTLVGTIAKTHVESSDKSVADGSLTFTWTDDPLATLGYKVRLVRKVDNLDITGSPKEFTATTVTFTGLKSQDYIFKIQTHDAIGYFSGQELTNVYLPYYSAW